MAELQLTQADLAAIQGSGNAGRVTIKDLESFLGGLEKQTAEEASAIRTGVADAMRRSWTRPLATVGVSVCLDPVLEDRTKRDPKPGPALYVLRALALALAKTPAAASRLIGGRAIRSESIDIGVAVEAQDGIMVPVIRHADKTSLADLTSRYTELVDLARRRRVTSEMTSGGIASVSNFGTFGLDWGTPIPLPDQTLLLGLGAGKKAPIWSEERQQFVPITQAELTLSFDHRSLDGGGAGRLLQQRRRAARHAGKIVGALSRRSPPVCDDRRPPLSFGAMNSTATIDPSISMRELLEQFPGAQRALFRRYHIGGCSSCGFSPDETLAGVCARNENLDVDEVTEHILASDAADRAMQIEPRELSERLAAGETIHLLDIRTREELDSVKLPGAHLFTQEFMQEILAKWSRTDLLVIYDHQGTRSMDAAAYFQGHGFEKSKVCAVGSTPGARR